MSAWAKPGVKCVCINAQWPASAWYGDEELPKEGETYTVRAVLMHASGELGILVDEILNLPRDYDDGFREAFWALRRFRPVSSIESDVSLFVHHLYTVEEPA